MLLVPRLLPFSSPKWLLKSLLLLLLLCCCCCRTYAERDRQQPRLTTLLCFSPKYHQPKLPFFVPPVDTCSYGSNFALYPTLTAEFFGATTAGPNYGLVFAMFGVGSFLAMLWLASGQKTSDQVFLVCAGISSAGTASAALLRARRRRRCSNGGGGGKLTAN